VFKINAPKKNIFYSNYYNYTKFIYENLFQNKIKEFYLKKSFVHFKKIDFLPKIIIILFIFIINFISKFFYLKNFYQLKNKKKKIFLLNFIFKFLVKIVDELLLALYLIQSRNNENIKKIKLNKNIKKKKFKFIIIGSGPAGSITALELQKNFGDSLLIEQGSYYEISKKKHPGDEFIKKWDNAGILTTIFPNQINFSSGKCLGGGSEINSGLYHFPKKEFFNSWKKNNGIKKLDLNLLNKINKDLLKNIPVNKIISKNVNSSYKEFCMGSKIAKANAKNIPRLASIKYGIFKKSSMTETILKDFIKYNGDVLVNSKVKKIYKNHEKSWVVEINDQNKFTCKYLFLCLGAKNTQELLINSNFSNNTNFNKFKLHPMIKVMPKFKREVQKEGDDVHSFQITKYYPNFILGEASSGKQFLEISVLDDKKILNDVKKNWRKMSVYHSTFSFGFGQIIKIPLINKFIYSYKIEKKELKKIKFALKTLCKILFFGGADYIYLLNKEKIKVYSHNFKEIIDNINKIESYKFSSVHILGKIEMGEKKFCYVDSFGKIKNCDQIFINDSSLISTPLLQNPQGTIMLLAYRNILEFIKSLKKKEQI
jgi:uncharacterized FAD-dependent dehydrogenase